VILNALAGLGLPVFVDAPWTRLFPALQPVPFQNVDQLASPEFQGQWWLLGVALVSFAFNYFLGEEFLFRGVLLPKMQGVFGKYDWVANAVLFGFYHLHRIWSLPSIIVGNLTLSWPARRYRSSWMAILVHGSEFLLTLVTVLAVILGLLPA
jgi:membrane protease YdiL (CAAX protease family)